MLSAYRLENSFYTDSSTVESLSSVKITLTSERRLARGSHNKDRTRQTNLKSETPSNILQLTKPQSSQTLKSRLQHTLHE